MTYCSNCIHYKVCGNEGVDDVAMTFCADKQIPSVEKNAVWVGIDDEPHEDWECDHCGFIILGVEEPYRFCPNCGAKVVEREEEE